MTLSSRYSSSAEDFRDQVLFLKHNLNAQAVASLEVTVGSLESDVARLIAEMDASTREANAFMAAMESRDERHDSARPEKFA